MRKSITRAVLATTLSAVALAPVATGVTLLTAGTAYAKSEKSRGERKERRETSRGKSAEFKGSGKSGATSAAAPVTVAAAVPQYGNSWKTRIEGGELSLHANEYGAWNSARRSPVAIANMAAKVREGKLSNGAGAMIGTLVVAYEDRNAAQAMVEGQLQVLVDGGVLIENVEAYLAGDLTAASVDQAVMDAYPDLYDTEISFDGTSYVCGDGSGTGACTDVDLSVYNTQLADLDTLENDTELQTYLADYQTADMALDTAQGTVQPKNSTEEADAIAMLNDIEQLLGIEEDELELIAPAPAAEEEGAPAE